MVTWEKFHQLPTDRKAHTVWAWATHLACIGTGQATRSLYYLNGFYVELIYEWTEDGPLQENRVLGVFAFRSTWYLKDWLEKVNIGQLLNS